MESTEMLVRRARDGDRAAFDEIVERFRERLERQVHSRMGAGVRGKVEADDILNETFACAFESIARLKWQDEETFYRWLASIAEHLIRNVSRRKGWSPLRLEGELAGTGTSPSQGLRRHDRFDRLERALNSLSPDHKTVLVLARIEGLRIREIAERMGRSTNAVKKLLARAPVRAQANLRRHGELPPPGQKAHAGGKQR